MATRHYADHGGEEESYFVSMTDVFIGLLFIFIIMLMFFAMRFQEATQTQNEVTQKLDEVTQQQKEVTKKQNALITLTSANHVIHLSRWWNPAVEDQCTDRVYRIGQDRTVHIYYPMAVHPLYGESSFDALLNALLSRKRDLSRRMLLPPVNAKQDQNWFADNLGRKIPQNVIPLVEIEDIDVMEPTAFERWALGRCISFGWEASRTPTSYDGGADGVLLHRASGARAIVQCKHTQGDNNACGPEAVDDLLRARANYDGQARLFVLTNAGRFSRSTLERAEKHGIGLVGRNELPHWPRQLLS